MQPSALVQAGGRQHACPCRTPRASKAAQETPLVFPFPDKLPLKFRAVLSPVGVSCLQLSLWSPQELLGDAKLA